MCKLSFPDYEWIKNVMTYSKRSFDKLKVFIASCKKLTKKESHEAFLLRNHYLGFRSSSQPEIIHVCLNIPEMTGTILKKYFLVGLPIFPGRI